MVSNLIHCFRTFNDTGTNWKSNDPAQVGINLINTDLGTNLPHWDKVGYLLVNIYFIP